MCIPCLSGNSDNLSDVTYGPHQKGTKKSCTPLQENTPHSLQEGRKTVLSLHPVIGVEPLHEITLHSQEGGTGNESPTFNPSSDTEQIQIQIQEVGSELSTFTNYDTIGNLGDPNRILNMLRANNSERLIIGHININFIENKFDSLASLVKDKVDIIIISETKIDDSFPQNQFVMEGYSVPFRLDLNSVGVGIMIYIRDDIPCKELKSHVLPEDVEGIFIEINIRKVKWILMGGYNPHRESISYFLRHVSYGLDKFLANYDNILLLGDFNSNMSEEPMMDFCDMYNLQNLIKEPTCYKNANNPSSLSLSPSLPLSLPPSLPLSLSRRRRSCSCNINCKLINSSFYMLSIFLTYDGERKWGL